MGQRHQIFVITRNDFSNRTAAAKQYGRKKSTVIGLHHQWLYGMNALSAALAVLEFNADYANHISNPYALGNNYSGISTARALAELTGSLIALRQSPDGMPQYSPAYLLNADEPWVLTRFDQGDNNDGVTIIDTLTGRYCFLNIYEQSTDEDDNNATRLPSMVPQTAEQYVRTYYPAATSATEINEQAANLSARFDRFPLLTIAQLTALFPAMEQTIAAAQITPA